MSYEVRTSETILKKTSAEVLKRDIDFTKSGLATGETISSVTSPATVTGPDSALTCTASPNGQFITAIFTAGTVGKSYHVAFRGMTNAGQTVEGAVNVFVGNP